MEVPRGPSPVFSPRCTVCGLQKQPPLHLRALPIIAPEGQHQRPAYRRGGPCLCFRGCRSTSPPRCGPSSLPGGRTLFPNPRAADRCRSVDQSAPGRPRNFNFISLWRAAEAQSIAPSQAGHGKIIQHLPVRGDKKVGQH
ncbi:hypothetical protein NDU88_008153 [Pleurodeles waltl]|uniref:Uncharacterized protein n=1 Tax=Pleurodeles waltl TaxID=8319 RepID=A0AAV7N8B7_PLEWA|nr:hypothetical protein NDU88_008153 [Pleurodeles waltl]